MTAAPAAAKPRYQRNFGLDLLRTLSIGIVLLNHGFIGFFIGPQLARWEGWQAALSACAVFSIEWLFILSGFLIGSMMIRSFEKQQRWWPSARDFWLRRWFRTLPNYYLFVLVNAALVAWGVGEGAFSPVFLVFSQNLLSAQAQPYFFSEAWSLALDEWFYFLMPLLLALTAWRGRLSQRTRFWLVALLLIATPTALRMLAPPPADFFAWDAQVRRVTVMHLDATGWGVAAAILSRWHRDWWTQRVRAKALLGAALTAGAAAAMFHFMLSGWQSVAGGRFNDLALIAAPSAGMVLMLPWLTGLRASAGLGAWLSARVGDYAYSVYLCHYPLLALIVHAFAARGWALGPVVGWVALAWVLLVLALSALVFHSFEKPVADLRERFTRRVQAGPFGGG